MPRRQPQFEEAAGHRLPLGGVNGYLHVRGKQGKKKDKFQGVTPRKTHRTGHHDTALEAAIAGIRRLSEDLELGMPLERGPKIEKSSVGNSASKKMEAGVYLGDLLRLQRQGVPTVRGALLSQQQAGDAAARGVALAMAQPLKRLPRA